MWQCVVETHCITCNWLVAAAIGKAAGACMGAESMNKTCDMLGLVCTVLKVMILATKLVEILMRIAGGATNYRAKSVHI